VDGHERVVAYASKLLVGYERNWINKTDGVSEIECWGIVWATRKFRCYLDRNEFDLYTDHKTLTWVFNEMNRISNAKLALGDGTLSITLQNVPQPRYFYESCGRSL